MALERIVLNVPLISMAKAQKTLNLADFQTTPLFNSVSFSKVSLRSVDILLWVIFRLIIRNEYIKLFIISYSNYLIGKNTAKIHVHLEKVKYFQHSLILHEIC